MFDKCIVCNRIGESCVPNLMLLSFSDLMQWCNKRQKYHGWSNQQLAEKSNVPVGTINRIKAGEYLDCKYSTMKNILIALIGGTTDEFSCTKQVEAELQQMEQLAQQAEALSAVEAENEKLQARLCQIEEQHRNELQAVKEEHRKQIEFLRKQIDFEEMQIVHKDRQIEDLSAIIRRNG